MKKSSTSVSGVYRIACHRNGKVYVGRALNIQKRWTRHRWELRHSTHRNSHLQRAWDKYGETAFTFEVACVIDEPDPSRLDAALAAAEIAELAKHPNAFNLMEAGQLGMSASVETRQKLSALRLEMWADPDFKERLRESHREVHADPAYSEKRAQAIRQARGSAESRATTREQSNAKWAPGGVLREGQGAIRKALWQDPEYKAKQKAARQAVWADPAVRAKRSAAIAAGHARRRAAKQTPPA